jgi:LysM repeat protein
MKKIVLLFISVAFCAIIYAQTDAIKQYVETYNQVAINEMIRTGVPAAITLAQGIVESKAGQSDLCQQSNNHFGIKCKDEWTGPYVLHDDDKKDECFRVYGNAEESFRDHSDFLKNRPYYTDLFNLDPADYKAWAKGLKKDGYATERDYPQMLVKMIEDNDLQQYTLVALERMKNPNQPVYAGNNTPATRDAAPAVIQQSAVNNSPGNTNSPAVKEDKDDGDADNTADANNTQQIAANNDNANAYPDGVFTINETRVVYAKAGASLFALASNYGVSYKSLLDFNELGNEDILDKNALIYLERKPKRGDKDYHIVIAAETIEDIAQKEGVRLESLLQYNTMQKGSQPAAGTKIYLRLTPGASARARRA